MIIMVHTNAKDINPIMHNVCWAVDSLQIPGWVFTVLHISGALDLPLSTIDQISNYLPKGVQITEDGKPTGILFHIVLVG